MRKFLLLALCAVLLLTMAGCKQTDGPALTDTPAKTEQKDLPPLSYKMAVLGQSASPSPGKNGFPNLFPTDGDMSDAFFYSLAFAVEMPEGCQVEQWILEDDLTKRDMIASPVDGLQVTVYQEGFLKDTEEKNPEDKLKDMECDTVTIFHIISTSPIMKDNYTLKALYSGSQTVLGFNAERDKLTLNPAYATETRLIEEYGGLFLQTPNGKLNIVNPFLD